MPPETIKSRTESASLLALSPISKMHPDIILHALPPSAKMRLVETQARWNDPSELFLPLWLTYLVQTSQANAIPTLENRLTDYPEDIWTLRSLLDTVSPERREELCEIINSDSESFPEDPDKA
jgi:hypothetical protein